MKITLIEANQDLGVDVDGADLGPPILTDYFIKRDEMTTYSIDKEKIIKERDANNRQKNLLAVNEFNEKLYQTVLEVKRKKELPLTIGGDHSIAIASSLASMRDEKSLGIIWIDAHSDYNTLATTVTGNLHGLPLAAINGQCQELTKFHNGEYFKPSNVVIIGARDIDAWELPNLLSDEIKIFTTDDIHEFGVKKVMDEAFKIATFNTRGVHISYDLDVIDPILAPGVSVPAPDGITVLEANQITDEIIKHKTELKSIDLVEYNPLYDIDDKTYAIAIDILKRVIEEIS